ncbi:uncharacterized protein LOC144073560 isoform X2 [Stigmatopora argus]
MRKIFVCDDSMVINISIGKDSEGLGPMLPKEFNCVFRDSFKVFVSNGHPKPFGAAQFLAGVLIVILILFYPLNIFYHLYDKLLFILPNILFLLGGILTYAAGHIRNIRVTKVSLCLNMSSFLWSTLGLCFTILSHNQSSESKLQKGMQVTITCLFAAESLMALFLIVWQSKAVCRQHFNTLPLIQLKLED